LSIKIEIRKEDAEDLVEFYVEKQKNIKNQMSALEASLKEINGKILELKQILKGEVKSDASEPEYSSKWHWVKKIEFAITVAGRPLTSKEIVDVLTDYDPSYIVGRKTAIASVSATLSAKSGAYEHHKDFVKIPAEWGDYLYDVWKEKVIEPIKENLDNQETDLVKIADSGIGDDLPF
jgi:hypothetical protein